MSDEFKWQRHFLKMAELVAQQSKDPSTKVGAVIVHPETKHVLSTGFNGFPQGVKDLPERYAERALKYELVAHAEVNAIVRAGRRGISVEGGHLYVVPTLMVPSCCNNCAKYVVQAGITKLWYWEPVKVEDRWEQLAKFTRILFDEGGVEYQAVPREADIPQVLSNRQQEHLKTVVINEHAHGIENGHH
jgi:dCMP deaminase